MNIQFIYFDLDDTLLDHGHAERAALADVRAAYPDAFDGVPVDTLRTTYRQHSVPLWRQYAAGTIEKEELKHERFEGTLNALGVDTLDAAMVSDFYLERYAAHWRFLPGARSAFTRLAKQFSVGVLTNGFVETQTKKLNRFPVLRERAEAVVICEETGYLKPHAAVFAHAAEAANTSSDHILYVGDSYHSDVQGGCAAGWQVAWFTSGGGSQSTSENCFVFDEWDDLLNYLQ